MRRFAADRVRRVLYYEEHITGWHPSTRRRGSEGRMSIGFVIEPEICVVPHVARGCCVTLRNNQVTIQVDFIESLADSNHKKSTIPLGSRLEVTHLSNLFSDF